MTSFLGIEWRSFAIAVSLLSLFILLMPRGWFAWASRKLVELSSDTSRLSIALVGVALSTVLLLPTSTYLLGDGYQLLFHFGGVTTPPLKWTEPGSIILVRLVQALLGQYSYETGLLAFKIISYVCGAIYFFNALAITSHIASSSFARAVCLITLLISGGVALFSGYVEFYPMTWAAGSTIILLLLKHVRGQLHLFWVVVGFLLLSTLHLQLLSLGLGVAFAVARQQIRGFEAHFAQHIGAYSFGTIACALTLAALLRHGLEFSQIFLPLLSFSAQSISYTMISLPHLNDIMNLTLLTFPGLPSLVLLPKVGNFTGTIQTRNLLLMCLSLGTGCFLFVVDPHFGMAIDWDLMSFCLLPMVLLLVNRLREISHLHEVRLILLLFLVSLSSMILFLTTLHTPQASERRFENLLYHYGSKNRSGWAVISDYYERRGADSLRHSILRQFRKTFPEEGVMAQGRSLLAQGKTSRAVAVADSLLRHLPPRSEVYQFAAEANKAAGDYVKSVEHYRSAIRLRPYDARLRSELAILLADMGALDSSLVILRSARAISPNNPKILEGMALVYIRQSKFKEAVACADSIQSLDKNDAGGNLIQMVVALNKADTLMAKKQFLLYEHYGKSRTDYEAILNYYGFLRSKRNN